MLKFIFLLQYNDILAFLPSCHSCVAAELLILNVLSRVWPTASSAEYTTVTWLHLWAPYSYRAKTKPNQTYQLNKPEPRSLPVDLTVRGLLDGWRGAGPMGKPRVCQGSPGGPSLLFPKKTIRLVGEEATFFKWQLHVRLYSFSSSDCRLLTVPPWIEVFVLLASPKDL